MVLSGGCHCGAVRYEVEGEPVHHAICHCGDCRASAGAPMVAWLAVKDEQFRIIAGEVATYTGATGSERSFCPSCGTGLFFRNAQFLPGLVDIQSATLDDSAEVAPGAQIQCAERLPWMTRLGEMPEFERFPGA
jgi:hypothetical protein